MLEHDGPAATLRELTEHAPELLAQLPRLPSLVLRTGTQLKQLEVARRRQRESIRGLEKRLSRMDRRSRNTRWAGLALILLASVLLWVPVTSSTGTSQDLSSIAGLLSAALGSLLLMRA